MSDFSWLEDLSHRFDEALTHGLLTPMVHALAAGGIGALVASVAHHRAMRAIKRGDLSSDDINITQTDYWPSGVKNSITGEEYLDQEIILVDDVKLVDIFNSKNLGTPIVKALAKAEKKAKEAGVEDPIIYKHLPEVISPKDWAAMQEAIVRLSVGHFSKMFNNTSIITRQNLGKGLRPVNDVILPLFVVEPGAKNAQSKMLLLKLPDGKIPKLPAIEDVRFENPNSEEAGQQYEPFDEEAPQPHADRYRLLQQVFKDLSQPENAWLKRFAVTIRTEHSQRVLLDANL